MVSLDAFQKGDVYIDFPFEDAKFRFEKETGRVFRRFYGQPEKEIDPKSTLFNEAISAGDTITREDYFAD
jgi:hypothetical protein